MTLKHYHIASTLPHSQEPTLNHLQSNTTKRKEPSNQSNN